jgi:hypothetical protein
MEGAGYSLHRLLGFRIKSEVSEVIALEVKDDGWKIRSFFRDNSGPVSGATELEGLCNFIGIS